jgi:peptidyl-prolyl cis-trans isomerase C
VPPLSVLSSEVETLSLFIPVKLDRKRENDIFFNLNPAKLKRLWISGLKFGPSWKTVRFPKMLIIRLFHQIGGSVMIGKKMIVVGLVMVGLIIGSLRTGLAEEKEVVAKVGSRVVTRAEFEQLLNKRGQGFPKDKQMETGLLNNLVQTMALGDAARRKGIDKRNEIKTIIELTIDGVLANELLKEEVLDKLTITEADAKKYYENHQSQFKIPEKVRVRHILIRADKSSSEEVRKKSKEKAEEVLKKAKSGEDFAKLAMEYSDDPGSKTKGGDLGFFERGRMVPAFEEAAFKLNPGEVSGVVETTYGFHIIKMEEKKKEENEPFEKIKDKVMNKARDEIRNEKVKAYLDQVMKEMDVKTFPEVLGKKE